MKQGWEIKRLDDACEVEYGTRVVQKKDGGTVYPVYGGGGATFFMDTFNREDCLVVARFAMSAQCTRFVEGKFFLNDSGLTVRPKNDKELLPDFLNLQMFFLNDHIYSLARGTAQRNLDVPAFRNIQIAYPKSIQEQQRIVSILDKAFAAIDKAKANAEQNLQNAQELFESYLQGVFEKKGADWQTRTLSDLVDEECKLSYGIVQPGQDYHDGLPVVRPTDLSTRYIKRQGLKLIDPKLAEGYKRTKLIGDELLLCVRGSTGVLSIATEELKGANVTRGIVPIRFNLELIDQDFGYYLLISNFVQNQIRVKTYGAALMQINIGDLRKIETPYPKSLNEQQTIVRKLDSLRTETQNLEAVYQKKIADLEELKKSVLQKAFAGELETEKVVVV
jgi:type I restriction enzyme S subunit